MVRQHELPRLFDATSTAQRLLFSSLRERTIIRRQGVATPLRIPRPPIAVLPDTADTRLLVELTSHAGDLSEAAHALSCALTEGEGWELWMPLTSHAVTAYIRPFIHSNVRSRLDEMSGVPAIPANPSTRT